MNILGISAYYHDSAAALLSNGAIVAAAQEERFTRKRHDASFPTQAIKYCLTEGDMSIGDVDYVVFYDKPLLKFERLLETYISYAPKGFRSFSAAMPIWLKDKLFLKSTLKQELKGLMISGGARLPKLLFNEHHRSHAASAFFASPFEKAAVLCIDGVGEWATTSVWVGAGSELTPLWEIDFPHSLGLLYSAFTYFAGFKVNSGEYKLMGLAPYGEPKYVDIILKNLIDLKDDGTFRLNMAYFNYATGLTMTNDRFANLFGRGHRRPQDQLTQFEMDLAASIQHVTEDIILRLAQTVHRETGLEKLCLAGGVALNCVANGRILRGGPFSSLWIQPAAGDAGGALGAALSCWHEYLQNDRVSEDAPCVPDRMAGSFLGPAYSDDEARAFLDSVGAVYHTYKEPVLLEKAAMLLAEGKVVGWHNGRMEFGPRALGARSILGDPRSKNMQSIMNLKIKSRESFRPFAPSVLAEDASEWFDIECESPYMLLVADVRTEKRVKAYPSADKLFGIERLKVQRSTIPAVTHVDNSARVQTVHRETNPRYHSLIKKFKTLTGCPVLVNTSFNVRGEPIVNTPREAFNCFMRTEMDGLVIGGLLLHKHEQPTSVLEFVPKVVFEED